VLPDTLIIVVPTAVALAALGVFGLHLKGRRDRRRRLETLKRRRRRHFDDE